MRWSLRHRESLSAPMLSPNFREMSIERGLVGGVEGLRGRACTILDILGKSSAEAESERDHPD